MTVLVVIPTLNEAEHVGSVLDAMLPLIRRAGGQIVVADGGSQDDTCAIVRARAADNPGIVLLHNPRRWQSAAINLAVQRYGAGATWLLRVDAHAHYPPDFGEILIAEAMRTGADSVVVAMHAVGRPGLQAAIADAQNSRFGTGGAAHRMAGAGGAWVDHGHHALMRIEAFRAVGGYDPHFSHNEDAELDHRLGAAGYCIWLTDRTRMDYVPRAGLVALMRQYFRFGRGRARNLRKHEQRPGPRQMVVAMLAPAVALALLAPLHRVFLLPLLVWLLAVLAAGVGIAVTRRTPRGLVSGLAAGLMQLAWSVGYWRERLMPDPLEGRI